MVSAVLIASTVHPASRVVPWVLGFAVFRWIGVRSYGIYLWHWPIYMVTRPHSDVPDHRAASAGPPPGAHVRGRRRCRTGSSRSRSATARSSDGGRSTAPRPARRSGKLAARLRAHGSRAHRRGGDHRGRSGQRRDAGARPGRFPPQAAVVLNRIRRPPPRRPSTTAVADHRGARSRATTVPPPTPAPTPAAVTAIGDSVMLGAANQLTTSHQRAVRRRRSPRSTRRRAASSRPGSTCIQVYKNAGQLGQDVIVQLGTNGIVDPGDFDRMMGAAQPSARRW